MLTEPDRRDSFARLAEQRRAGAWRIETTAEDEAVRLVRGPDELFVIAGRQLDTREDLHVLALATLGRFCDGVPLADAVAQTAAADALPVVSWGPGKWWGRRGRMLRRYLATPHPHLFLGDNGGRTPLMPGPENLAAELGLTILPGTDPTPFAEDETRPGAFGFGIELDFDPARPAASIRRALAADRPRVEPFGRLQPPLRFVGQQLRLQWRKRRGQRAP